MGRVRRALIEARQFGIEYVRFQIDRGVAWWLERYNGTDPRKEKR